MEIEEIPSSSGQAHADAAFNVVRKTRADKSVRGLLFDTTAGNIGVRLGAAKLLLEKFGRPLLWLECRHHTAELVLSQHGLCSLVIATVQLLRILLISRNSGLTWKRMKLLP